MADPDRPVADQAEAYFRAGHNCAMAVLRAVAEAEDLACPDCVPAAAIGFGGGIGHTGRVCGALAGGTMALGLAAGAGRADPTTVKEPTYAKVRRLAGAFEAAFGDASCRGLLGFAWTDPDASARFSYDTCARFVRKAAAETLALLEEAGQP